MASVPSLLDELLDEANHGEPLLARERAMLLDLDLIAHLVLIGLVVRLEAAARADVLAVERIGPRVDALHHDGLVHLVADDLAHDLAAVVALLVASRSLCALLRRFGHGYFSSLALGAAFVFFAGALAGLLSAGLVTADLLE